MKIIKPEDLKYHDCCEAPRIVISGNDEVGYRGSRCTNCDMPYMRVLVEGSNQYTFVPQHQCEFCNDYYEGEPVPFPDPSWNRFSNCTFCCDQCAREAYDDAVMWQRRDQMNYECYGTDVDSWE